MSDGYANPNLPTASLRKDLLLFLQTARGLGLEMVGLDGLAEVLELVQPPDWMNSTGLPRGRAGMGAQLSLRRCAAGEGNPLLP